MTCGIDAYNKFIDGIILQHIHSPIGSVGNPNCDGQNFNFQEFVCRTSMVGSLTVHILM